MHRIQLAANAWHAAMEVEKYDVALHWMREIGGIYRSLTKTQRSATSSTRRSTSAGTSLTRMMMKLNESELDEFSVSVFHHDGTRSYMKRWVSRREALTIAMILTNRAGSTFDRVIITDGGDDTVFRWEHGKGIT